MRHIKVKIIKIQLRRGEVWENILECSEDPNLSVDQEEKMDNMRSKQTAAVIAIQKRSNAG